MRVCFPIPLQWSVHIACEHLAHVKKSTPASSASSLKDDCYARRADPSECICMAGAKDKLGLRVHGLIVGSPDKKRADPAVLRQLCAHTLPNGKNEVRPPLLRLLPVSLQLHVPGEVPFCTIDSLPMYSHGPASGLGPACEARAQ